MGELQYGSEGLPLCAKGEGDRSREGDLDDDLALLKSPSFESGGDLSRETERDGSLEWERDLE